MIEIDVMEEKWKNIEKRYWEITARWGSQIATRLIFKEWLPPMRHKGFWDKVKSVINYYTGLKIGCVYDRGRWR